MAKPSVGVLHRLAPGDRAPTPEAVASSLVALHATDPASVHLAVAARTAGPGAAVDDIDRALYDDTAIVRVMGMRRTLWAVPAALVPVVAAACGRAIAAVAARGAALTRELTHDVPRLEATVRLGGTSKWAVDVGLSSRVVLLLTCDGRLVRTRPRGGWTSRQHRYAVAPSWGDPLDTHDAQTELARRWLAAFGPFSDDLVRDLRWWTGWTVAATKRALAAAGDVPDAPAGAELWAALVPSLDPTTMGWKERSWYLGDLGHRLFDRNGNAGPAIWWSGRVVGGWAQPPTGEVATRVLVDVGRDALAAIDAEAARLQAWLDASGAVVRPRFATPLHKELAA